MKFYIKLHKKFRRNIHTHTYLRICHSYFPRFSVNYSYEECTNVPCPYIDKCNYENPTYEKA